MGTLTTPTRPAWARPKDLPPPPHRINLCSPFILPQSSSSVSPIPSISPPPPQSSWPCVRVPAPGRAAWHLVKIVASRKVADCAGWGGGGAVRAVGKSGTDSERKEPVFSHARHGAACAFGSGAAAALCAGIRIALCCSSCKVCKVVASCQFTAEGWGQIQRLVQGDCLCIHAVLTPCFEASGSEGGPHPAECDGH